MPGEGEAVATELFYMRIGTLRYSRRWIDPDAVLRGQIFLTALSALLLLLAGFVLGWVAARTTMTAADNAGGRPMISFGSGSVYDYDESSGILASSVASVGSLSSSSSSWLDGIVSGYDGGGGEGSINGGCEKYDCGGLVGTDNMFSLASRSRSNLSSVY